MNSHNLAFAILVVNIVSVCVLLVLFAGSRFPLRREPLTAPVAALKLVISALVAYWAWSVL